MKRRALLLAPALALATAAGTFASPPDPTGLPAPVGAFVLDGGDLEAAAPDEGFPVAPVLDDRTEAAAPSLAASLSALDANPYSDPQAAPATRPMAFEYSDGYYKRLKIHKYASYATIPLFAAQFAVGQKLYNGDASDGMRSAHTALAASTGVLFGVNSVTGVWNLLEARKDPHKSTKRTVHGILMLVADAGFVATGLMAPEGHESELGFEGEGGGTSRSTHRAVALTSMGIATVAYLMMPSPPQRPGAGGRGARGHGRDAERLAVARPHRGGKPFPVARHPVRRRLADGGGVSHGHEVGGARDACGACSARTRREAIGRISTAALATMAGVALRPGSADAVPVVERSGAETGSTERTFPLPATDGVTIDRSAQVIVVRFQQKAYAFNLACPHENTALRWRKRDGRFQCPRHESQYQPDGTFIEGRATRNMDRFAVRRSGDTLVVDLNRLFRSDEQATEWVAAAVSV